MIYQQYPANAPVWTGGRSVLTAGVGSDVSAVFADNGSGVLLPDRPFLQFYPAAQNDALHSQDFLNPAWTTGSATLVQNQIGLRAIIDKGWLCTNVNVLSFFQQFRNGYPAQTATLKLWVRLGLGTSVDSNVRFIATGSGEDASIQYNPQTGALITVSGTGSPVGETNVNGDVMTVLLQVTTAGVSTGIMRLLGDVLPNDHVILNAEWHDGKTIPEVRNLGPIFTTAGAAATDETTYTFDPANSADTTSAIFMEVASDGAQNILNGFLSIVGTDFQLSDGTTTVTRPWTESQVHQVGIAYGDNQMSINVDGTFSADVPYDGTMLQGAFDLFRSGTFPAKIRDLRRNDADSYVQAKSIITGLMS